MQYRQRLVNAIPHTPATVMYQLKEGAIDEQRAGQLLGQMIVANRNSTVNALGNVVRGKAVEALPLVRVMGKPTGQARAIRCIETYGHGCTVEVTGRAGWTFRLFVRNGEPSALRIGQILGVLDIEAQA